MTIIFAIIIFIISAISLHKILKLSSWNFIELCIFTIVFIATILSGIFSFFSSIALFSLIVLKNETLVELEQLKNEIVYLNELDKTEIKAVNVLMLDKYVNQYNEVLGQQVSGRKIFGYYLEEFEHIPYLFYDTQNNVVIEK